VRPKISSDGTIRMEVAPEFSRLTGFTPGDNQPIIDRRTAATTLRVANGQTVVIGGLRQRQDIGDFKGVPYLMDIRYVGKLFRARDTNVRESELVVFISPEIIDQADPINFREQRVLDTIGCRLNQVPPAEGCPPPCGYEFPAVEPVRLPPPEGTEDGSMTPADDGSMPAEAMPANTQPSDITPVEMLPPQDEQPPVPTSDLPLIYPTTPAAEVSVPVAVAATPPAVRRLPTLHELHAAPTAQATNLFAAPPRPGSVVPRVSNRPTPVPQQR
jgi:general secretion pathway protein D